MNGTKREVEMSKFYDYIKSKEKEVGKGFFCEIEIEKTEKEDKVIIYYRSFSFSNKEKKKEEGLRYLIINTGKSIDVFISYGDLYIPTKQAGSYVREGNRLKKLFSYKEFKDFEKREENEQGYKI